MKKLMISVVLVLLLFSMISAVDFIVGLRVFYIFPSEEAFRDVYGGGINFGSEVSIVVLKNIELSFTGNYFSKKGELSYTKEETKVSIFSFGMEGRYIFLSKYFNLYVGPGLNYYSFKESNILGDVSKGGIGFKLKVGGFYQVTNSFIVDIFVDYAYCKMKPADYEINLGGVETGIGFRYKF